MNTAPLVPLSFSILSWRFGQLSKAVELTTLGQSAAYDIFGRLCGDSAVRLVIIVVNHDDNGCAPLGSFMRSAVDRRPLSKAGRPVGGVL